ncbi:Phosphonate metabolism protein (modular protein) [uncultured delta proteobacterium]|uniref:Phosphonate metabolism protein (Modular protein) n=1 Tax=uncultured delta proteobacterium TaxID=34034 RepID=A0A212K6A6_9DELT|nr:Phosphonate metabolism protein (modular protein) [uncultured delta proteobacterium]
MKAPRYAVYHVPERGSALERLGSSLLGRDIHGVSLPAQPDLGGLTAEELFSLTRDARRYGLHATLKPPFFLQPGMTEHDLIDAAEAFTAARRPLPLPALAVTRIGSFLALTVHPRNDAEAEEAENVRILAREAVAFFDGFRAPPSEEELNRRRAKGLTLRQERYLWRWGYPYVFDEFRFHITLTDSIRDPILAAALEANLRLYLAPACKNNWIEAITVCRSDGEGNFTVLHRAPFPTGISSALYAAQPAPHILSGKDSPA